MEYCHSESLVPLYRATAAPPVFLIHGRRIHSRQNEVVVLRLKS